MKSVLLKNIKHWFNKFLFIFISMSLLIAILPICCIEAEENKAFDFTTYIFDKDSKYKLSEGIVDENNYRYGEMKIIGNYDENKTASYFVNDGVLSFYYNYNKNIHNIPEDEWHICKDSSTKVNNIDVKGKVDNGVIIVQSSKDGEIWSTEYIETNAFENIDDRKDPIFTTTDVQLNAGAYYRIIVAYEMEKYKDTTKVLFVSHKNYEYKKYAEVYSFYASNGNSEIKTDNTTRKYSIGKKVLCEKFSGYYGEKNLKSNDLHYGWDLGHFFITGYTGNTKYNNELVILKNVGDEVTLWFNLEQDINSLNKDDNMRITADNAGYDQYFETDTQDFGKGALIIKKINADETEEDVNIYTNFLEANAKPGTDTVVQLFEEGDYEVALDYEVTKDTWKVFDKKIADKIHHYRIYFKFSVRNSNCMVYPLDVKTNQKIINGSYSKDGFYLDLAKSKYLQINVKKSTLKDGTYDLVEDTEYNQLANEGSTFTEEGLYEITVTNKYTNISDVKRIYVGDNDLLKAYAVTGLSISELKKKIESGMKINEDGTLGDANEISSDISFAGLDDEDLLKYVEDNIYYQLIPELNRDDIMIEDVSAKYVSKDYIKNITYNSRSNLYFGYDTKDLNNMMNGQKYIFTLGPNGKTIVKPIDKILDTITEDMVKNVVVGSGVILICVTVSITTRKIAPAIKTIFWASAVKGTSFALHSGGFAAVSASIIRGYQTGDIDEAIKAGALAGSEGFKWGAISGAITGGAEETYALYNATKGGLTMNQVAKIQQETRYPLDVIKHFENEEQVKILKDAGLIPEMINGKLALLRDIDLNFVDEFGRTNKERILQNLSPLDPDGIPYEVHHVGQDPKGTLAILTEAEHRSKETYSIWHSNKGPGVHQEISNQEWAKTRSEFWKAYLKLKG